MPNQERMQIYQMPDGSFQDYEGNPLPADVQDMGTGGAMWEGLKRSGGNAVENLVNLTFPGTPFPQRSPEEEARWNQISNLYPVSSFAGQAVPSVVGFGSKKAGMDRVLSGVEGILMGDPNTPAWQRGAEGLVGREFGDMAGRIVGKLFNWNKLRDTPSATNTQQKMADQFEAGGGQLSPGQRTGNKNLKNLESGIESGQFTGDLFDDMAEHNTKLYSQKAGRAMGLPESYVANLERLDIDALRKAKKLQAAEFDRIRDQLPDVTIDEGMANNIRKNTPAGLKKLLDYKGIDLGKEGDLDLDGDTLMRIRSAINKGTNSTDGYERELAGSMVNDIDDLIEANITDPDLMNRWSKVRGEWRVREALSGQSRMKAEGGLNPKSAWNKIAEIEKGSDALKDLQSFNQAYASESMKLPFNMSNTSRAGQSLFRDPIGAGTNWLSQPLANKYMRGDVNGLLSAALNPAPEAARQVGRGIGRSYGATE